MNVALLISEMNSNRITEICQGASFAAKELEITLVIVPGKKLSRMLSTAADQLYAFQSNLNYTYVSQNNFDAVIVDIDEIGQDAIILKKESFLNHFGNTLVFTLSGMEGYFCATQGNEGSDKQIGYNAIYRSVYYIENQKFPLKIERKIVPGFTGLNNNGAGIISEMAEILLLSEQKDETEYQTILSHAIISGFRNAVIFLFEEEQNLADNKLNIPEYININVMVCDGKAVTIEKTDVKNKTTGLLKVLDSKMRNSKVWVMKNLFLEEKQLGLGFFEMNEVFMISEADKLITAIIAGSIKIGSSERKKIDLEKELLECQEELARDDSVLDHIGERDQMTGIYNRRGFFAAAYDRLKQKFLQETYAIVAYIDIDSIKNINDIYGREEGDYAVKRVSDILNTVFGQECVIGRIRGDEFAILLISEEEGSAEEFRSQMTHQNALLMSEITKPYLMHLQFSICEFQYSNALSLRDMLMETDSNLKKIKKQEQNDLIDQNLKQV